MRLADVAIGQSVSIERVGGERSFRRRLMELGLVPGTRVQVMGIAPLGDPIELLVRGSSLSIRHNEANAIWVHADVEARAEALSPSRAPRAELDPGALGAAGPS